MRIAVETENIHPWTGRFISLAPGILLSCLVALAAFGLEAVEVHITEHRFVENLVPIRNRS